MHHAQIGARMNLRLLVAATLAVTPMLAHALGLGRFIVHSGLDEPLNAQIELISPTAQEIKTLKAALASREDFDIAGVERSAYLYEIKYNVSQGPGGKYFIKATTDQQVREPFLHFLVQVDWTGGRLIREYSALLDPPNWVGGKPAEIEVPELDSVTPAQAAESEWVPAAAQPPESVTTAIPESTASQELAEAAAAEKAQLANQDQGTPASVPPEPAAPQTTDATPAAPAEQAAAAREQQPSSEPAIESAEAPAAAAVPPETAAVVPAPAAPEEYGPIKSGETLTQIAGKVNADKSFTSQQVMIALLRSNPSAFHDNNVNILKTGKILKVPERDKIAAITSEQAVREFRVQYDAWQEYKLKLAGSSRTIAVADAEKPAAEPKKDETRKSGKAAAAAKTDKQKSGSAKAEPIDLLKIVRANLDKEPAEETTKTPGVETKKDAGKEQRALTDRVATMEEAIESKQLQNKEMRERVGKLQEQAKNTERLIELENKQLAEAQKKAALEKAAQEKAAQEKVAQEKATQEKATQEKATQEKAAQEKAAAEAAAKLAQAVPAKPEAAAKTEPAAPAAAAPKPAPAPAAKKPVAPPPPVEDEGFLSGFLANIMDNTMVLALLAVVGVLAAGMAGLYAYRRRRASREFSESILSSNSLTADSSMTDPSGQAAASDTSFLSDFSQGGMGNIHTDEVDPIAEAEVYLAYGRDEQAEEILKDAVVKDPARQELKGKLLEIYFQRNDVAAFETVAEELYAALEGKGGKVWEKAEEMGRKLSPTNPMFRGGKPASRAAKGDTGVMPGATTLLMTETSPPAGTTSTTELHTPASSQMLDFSQPAQTPASSGLDFNLDMGLAPHQEAPGLDTSLDFNIGGDKATATAQNDLSAADSGLDLDFGFGETAAADTSSSSIDFGLTPTPESGGIGHTTTETAPVADNTVEFPAGGMRTATMELEGAAVATGEAGEGGLPGWDETATKLDLAKAYIDMGDSEGARSILDEVMSEGNDQQKKQAQDLASQIAA
jgi:pilus assembly protein FimV